MQSFIIWPVIAALLAGLVVKFGLDFFESDHRISWAEFGIGAAIIIVVLAPSIGFLGWHLSKAEVLRHHEYWNGWELVAYREDITCEEDGSCRYSYDCHPYLVYVSQTCSTTDSNGNTSSYECGHYETRYHQCPYVDMETNFIIQTTLGDYTISAHRFPDNPQAHRWDRGEEIPDSVIASAETGIPQFWADAKRRIDSGWPGPVTARRDYDNYILASDHTILKQYSSDIERFQRQKLLPPVTSDVHDFYLADKVHFVGWTPKDATAWQDALNRLNAALGVELQGDVQIVIIHSSVVDNDKDSYTFALKAYWQDKKVFGKDVMSKNGIGIVIGTTDGTTVSWARAFTGMPLGNEHLLVALESGLKGQPLSPAPLIGGIKTSTSAVNDPGKQESRIVVRSTHWGAIASILWGDHDQSTRFTRISMGGKGDTGGHGSGFMYLKSEIVPTDSQKSWISWIIFFVSCCVWAGAAVIGTDQWPGLRTRY